jgi:hemerythrin-like domain-containing protein
MYTLDELKKQNREINDLIDLLAVLTEHENLRHNPFACELVSRFNEKVWMHLVFEDNTIYAELAKHHNPEISRIANQFHASAREVKKHFTHYVKLWCNTSTDEASQATFIAESKKVFKLIRQRVQFESEEIFPLVEQHFSS